ncbi:MAG: hypothetical protein IKV85_05245 [Ruminococcus sp.]|nr:hypothetical protein [Ruminococcus sp.]
MPFCTNCGRQLAENEVCSCKNQQTTNPTQGTTPPPMPTYNGKPMYDHLGRPLFTPNGRPITYDENGNPIVKKSNTGCIIAIVVTFVIFVIIAVLGAILVPAMVGYTSKAKIQTANADAKTLLYSFEASLEEMDETGHDVSGTYVISSDESDNLFCSHVDTDKLYKTLSFYNDDVLYGDWFVIVENGRAVYCATESGNYIGTYPARTPNADSIPTYNGGSVSSNADLDDIYADSCRNLIPLDYNDLF